MATRETKVKLTAQVQEYIAGMEAAAKQTRETGTAAEKLAQQRMAFEQLGRASLLMGVSAAAGVGLAIKKWADFDQAMSAVQAATHESAENMDRLRDAALEAGARTVFSAEEAANAIEELAKAGVSTTDILNGGLDGALDLAAAGNLAVADAAGIAATALKTFNLQGSDMAHVADLLAAGAGKAMGDVTDLSAALNQSSMVAHATGLSIEETTAGLSAFASQGLLGSDAGTSFKSMLQALNPTSVKSAQLMKDLGISAYDSQGNFIGLAKYAGVLQRALADKSTEERQSALSTIFGSDAIRAATVLYSEGADGIQEWIDKVSDQGYAAETAAARLDNLKGDLEALGGALDTALIKTGSGANDVLRGMVQAISSAVDAYNGLPAPLQSAAFGLGVLVAGIGLLGGAALLALPKIAEFKVAVSTLGVTVQKTSSAMLSSFAALGVALAATAITMTVFSKAVEAGKTPQTEFASALKRTTDLTQVLRMATENTKSNYWTQDFRDQLEDLPALLDHVAESNKNAMLWIGPGGDKAVENLKQMGSELAVIAQTDLSTAQDAIVGLVKAKGLDEIQTETMLNQMPELKAVFDDAATSIGVTADQGSGLAIAMGWVDYASEKNKRSLEGIQGVAVETSDAVSALADEIENFGKANISSERSTIAFRNELAELKKKSLESSDGINLSTKASRENRTALLDMAGATSRAAADAQRAGESQEVVNGILRRGRKAILDAADAFGASKKEAKAFADEHLVTARTVEKNPIKATAKFDSSAARTQFSAWLSSMQGKSVTVVGQMAFKGGVNPSAAANHANGAFRAYADGGVSTGIYRGGTPIIKFAEPETGWEAFISGKASQRDRNRQIWVETGSRLGMNPGGQHTVQVPVNITVVDADGVFMGTFRTAASAALREATRSVSSHALQNRLGV